MPRTERAGSVRIGLDGTVGLGEVEEAAMGFAREAPAQLVAEYDRLDDRRARRRGRQPVRGAAGRRGQTRGAMVLHRLRSRRGFRRPGFRPKPREGDHGLWAGGVPIPTAGGTSPVSAASAPAAELLDLLSELAGLAVAARSIRREVVGIGILLR